MAANNPAVGTGTWTVTAPGTITAGQQNNPAAVINVPVGTSVVATWTVVNGSCTVSSNVTLQNDAPPTAPLAGGDQTQCNNPAFTLAANAPTVGTGAWSVVSSTPAGFTFPAGSVNNPTASITVPVGSTVTLRWTTTNGTCSQSDDITLTNDAPPTTADAGPNQTNCNTPSFTLAANAPTVGTGTWSVVSSTPAGFIFPAGSVNDPAAVITVPAGTTVTLRWTTKNGSCTSTDDITLINNALPTAPLAGPDQEKCNTPSFTLAANAPTVGTGAWSVVSSTPAGFTFPSGSVNNPAAVINVPAGTIVTLRWTTTNGTCSLTDDVMLTNFEAPADADAGPDHEECNNTSTFTLAANAPSVAGATGTWSVVSPAGFTFPAAEVNNPTASITVPVGTVLTLRWTITNGLCTTADDVILTNYAEPDVADAGPAQSKCAGTDFVTAANAPIVPGAVGTWTVVSGIATIKAGEEHLPIAHITVPNGGTATLRWTIKNGLCENFDEVILTNFLTPSPANAGPDQRDCNIPTFTMSANAPDVPGATGTWTLAVGSPGSITPGDENKPDAVINVPTGATATAIWTITNGTCPSEDTVLLTNDEMPSPAIAGPDQENCNHPAFTMAANTASVGVGKWSLTPGTTASFDVADSTNINAIINVPAGVTVTATWTITNGTCVTSDDVVLTNYVAPAPSNAGPDQEKCNTPTFTMAAAAPSVGVGKWRLVPGSTASFAVTDSTNRTAVFNVPVGESAEAIWAITNGVCTTEDTVRLTNYVAPAPAAAGPDQEQCNTPAFTMAANTPTVGVGKWSLPAGSTASFPVTDSTNPSVIITVPAGVTVTATWTITNGVCTTSDNVVLTNNEQPTAAAAGPNQEQCNTPAFRMAANTPSVGVGKWSLSAGTTASFAVADSTNPNAVITVPVGVTVTATWTIRNGNCVTSDDVELTNYAQPAQANAGGDMTHCDNDRFVMAANTPSVGTGTWSLPAGTTASINAADWNNPNAVITVPAGVVVTATWTITNGTCTTSDNVILTNHEMPSNAVAGLDQTHCDDPNFTMSANVPSPATAAGTWTIISGAATIADIHNPSTRVTVAAGGTVTLRWTITNGTCTSTPDDVVLTNQAAILGNTITADQLLCANETPAMLQGATLSGGNGTFTYQWQVSTTSATTGFANVAVNGTNATFNPPMITQNTWYRRVVMSGACTGNISNAVMLTLMNIPPVVISVPGPLTVDCVQGTDYTTKFGTPVFSHAPYNNEPLTVTHNDVTTTVDACTFTIQRTWTAMDRCGLTTQAQQTITVIDRTAPVFTATAPANVTVDCDKVPAAVNLPANDACTGVLTIVPIEVRVDQPGACASNYQLIRKWVAVDACGNASDTLRQVITVRDMTPPVFNNPAPTNITVDCDKVPAGQPLTANDNCTPGVITVIPVDVRKNLSGSRCADNYQIIRTWTATDLCGNKTVLTQTITVQDTIKPRFSMSLPPAITVDCDKVPTVATITATDNCTVSVAVKVSEKKEFLSTVCTSNYRLTRTWTAIDNCGNTATMQQVITVQDTTRPVFVVMPPADTTVSCDAIPTPPTNLSARDNCSTVKISYTQTRETIPGACASNYRLIRIWTAKDQCNNTNIIRQVITVTDTTKPVIDPAPANVTLNCGEAVPAAATLYARDNCDATFPKKATMTQDPFVVDLCAGYTIVRRWRIADACGNQAIERVQTITVNPCPKPALDPNLPANCSNNTRFAIMLQNKVSKPKFTLVSVVPASAVRTPLTQSSNVFDLNGATQATFIVTDGVTGCVSDPITYDLQYVMKPVVDLGADVAICQGSSVTLDAGIDNAAYTIRWSTGASTQTIDVTTAGTYTVTVSNGICTTTDAINVTVNMPPVVDIQDAAICMGETTTLNAYVQGATYVWSTGETTASIDVTTSGTYSVDVTLKGCTTHDEATVTVGTPPVITVTDDSEICPDETLMLTVDPDGGNVAWSTGETTNSIVVTKAGNYEVTVTRDGCKVTDMVTVTERPDLDIDLGPDREFCTGGRVVVDATHPDAISYLWNDGETTPIREIVMPGKYVVSVMDRFCSRITMDSVNVTVAGIPETLLPADTTLCIGEDLTLKVNAGIGNTIRWQDGSSGATYKVTGPGTYTVTVSNECGSVTDNIVVRYQPCEPKPQFPTGFTPNGDGHNDIFKPVVRGPMYDYDLRIYNRWGELIFLSKDQKNGWDGRYKGALVENGTYVWMLSYKKVLGGAVNIVKGEVTAIR
ncbi:gliding motility-associated C-terminal domain-containing protein [Chitinophaga sp. S165]|uniref:gliding motility-associated C-terminal domain-containing protein n=1 Tax=Chitinophaga sp. S165 TaxID=2135462 RepID=UPI001E4B586F|nr:gliding motility-associated C-terminal domain-containing protein [Chitinophaga sp. S165]